ncbi:MAG TPA: YggU family protein [Thiotrichales bacterium]|nr:YggU family protein [Thiotrichales bacterium]
MNGPWRWDGEDLILDVHVQPRARRDEIVGRHGDRLKIRITAPPVEGRANRHLCAFLAEACGVARSDVRLLSGEGGREKRVRIHAPRILPRGIPAPER